MQFSPSLGECHDCASSSKNPAKPDRMDGGTESILRYRCLNGHHAPGSFSRLVLPLLTFPPLSRRRFERILEKTISPSMSASLPFFR